MLGKADLIDEDRRTELANRHPGAVLISAVTGEGLDALIERIEEVFARTLREVELLIPYDEGGRLAELHEIAGDLEREETPDGVRVLARLPATACRTLRAVRAQRPPRMSDFRVQRLDERAKLPTRAYPGDAGLDLYALEGARLAPGERQSVRTGIAVEIPDGQAGLVLPRVWTRSEARDRSCQCAGAHRRGLPWRGRVLLLNTDPTPPSR